MKSFPVHLLPDRAFSWVLQNMENYEQLAYSFCSTKAKKAVKSLKLKAEEIEFRVSAFDQIGLDINFKNIRALFSINYDMNFPNNEIIVRGDIEVFVRGDLDEPGEWKWNFQDFEFKKWLHHTCDVFHHSRLNELVFDSEDVNDGYMEPIRKAVEGLQIKCLTVHSITEPVSVEKALETFSNCEEFYLGEIPFESHEVHKINKFLMQNLKCVCINDAEEIKMNQVVVSNSEMIQLNFTKFTEKDLNKFLKLWSRGCSPRLKYFYTRGNPQLENDIFDKEIIFKGIKNVQVPLDCEDMYREYVYGDRDIELKLAGGSRIWRMDGTTAVILVTADEFGFILE